MGKNKIETNIDIKNIDIVKTDLKSINLQNVSFEDAMSATEKINIDMQSGKLGVADFQKAYEFGSKLLKHAKQILADVTLSIEIVGEENGLKNMVLDSSRELFTQLDECVKTRNLGGVDLALAGFTKKIAEYCKEIVK